jgi:hypothetical protein
MRGKVSFVAVVIAFGGCASTPPSEGGSASEARLSTAAMVDVEDLAQNLALGYREQNGGFIELRAHPDNVIFVHESRNARVNGELVRMGLPCMRRGTGYIVSSSDADLVTRTLTRARKDREPEPQPIHVVTEPQAPKRYGLPQEWQPRARHRPWRAIVIHHMASGTGSAAVIHRIHRQKGWDGIGYHFVIGNGTLTDDGAVEVAYRWTGQKVGAHCRQARNGDGNWWNRNSIGICLIGDFTEEPPSEVQMRSLRRLVRALMDTYGIPATAVVPHGSVKVTACPGRLFPWREFVNSIR